MARLIFSLVLVVFGMGAGYCFRLAIKRRNLGIPVEKTRKMLQRVALLVLNPVAILGATWVANIQDIKIAAMPVLGVTALFCGGMTAYAGSRFLKLSRQQTGSFVVCGGFTNIGSLGALFCFIFLGEKGFALVPFYKLFEELIYYAVGFPIAKSFSDDASGNRPFIRRLASAATDIFVVTAVLSILTGLLLNLSGVQRPQVYADINAILIPLAALLLLVSIGMAMQFSSVRQYFKPALIICSIKFVIVPFLVVSIGYGLGLGNIDSGLPLKVVMILSAMPVGFIAMVPPTIYRLDIDIANACWLLTNGLLVLIIPILAFLLGQM